MASAPLYMTPVSTTDIKRGDGTLVCDFVESYSRVTKDGIAASAGELIKMRQWQRNLAGAIYARRKDGRYKHRQALIGLPRKNGKSALGSSFALHGLIMAGQGAEVYSCAADKDQARIVFGVTKRMVQMDPELDSEQGGIIKIYRDALEYVETGSVYKVLSSEAITKEGLNPNVVVYDELHGAPTDELYNVMSLGSGTRKDPLLIAITTAGVKSDQTGGDSTCYRLYQHGVKVAKGEETDETYFMAWWGAPDGADYRDPKVWERANPGYNDLIDPEDFKSVLSRIPENEFRTKRMNQWVSAAQAWLPQGAWEDCRDPDRDFTPGRYGVVLGFDGSKNGDTTALVAVTVEPEPVVTVLGLWEKPPADDNWTVPRGEVKDRIRQACRDYDVREIAADEWIWSDALEELADEGLPVVSFPQIITSMGPATQRFYEMVMTRKIHHDGHKGLARHLDNAQLKTDNRGSRIMKDAKNSPRKIDAAVAAVMAVDRAGFWLTQPGPESYVWKDHAGVQHSKPVSEVGFVW